MLGPYGMPRSLSPLPYLTSRLASPCWRPVVTKIGSVAGSPSQARARQDSELRPKNRQKSDEEFYFFRGFNWLGARSSPRGPWRFILRILDQGSGTAGDGGGKRVERNKNKRDACVLCLRALSLFSLFRKKEQSSILRLDIFSLSHSLQHTPSRTLMDRPLFDYLSHSLAYSRFSIPSHFTTDLD